MSAAVCSSSLTGIAELLRFMLRRDRVRLPAWAGGLSLYVAYTALAVPAAYSLDELSNITEMLAGPVGRLLIGPGYGLDEPTYERVIANGYGLYLVLLAALMSILTVVRHTRLEEQTGRAELLRADVVGRHATLAAALATAVLTNLAAGVGILFMMVVVAGFGFGGSLLLAAGVVSAGLVFVGVASVTVQLTQYSRAASGLAGVVLGLSFTLRAVGDMVSFGGNAVSWLSPLAWSQQTGPFVLDRWWPLGLSLAAAAGTALAGYQLSLRRDFGASFMAVRPGRSRARPSLGTAFGLALRLQRSLFVGWASAVVAMGLLYGAFADALLDAAGDLPEIFTELFGAEDMLAGYLAYMALFMAWLAAAYAVMAVGGWRSEETSLRGEPLLALPLGRWRWLGVNLAVTGLGVVVLMLLAGLATGVAAALVTGDATHLWELTVAHLNQVPPVLVVLALAALVYGAWPRLVGVVWALVGYAVAIGTFGELLGLPEVFYDVSPFSHPAGMPVDRFAPLPVLLLCAVAAGSALAGLASFRRRDFNSV